MTTAFTSVTIFVVRSYLSQLDSVLRNHGSSNKLCNTMRCYKYERVCKNGSIYLGKYTKVQLKRDQEEVSAYLHYARYRIKLRLLQSSVLLLIEGLSFWINIPSLIRKLTRSFSLASTEIV